MLPKVRLRKCTTCCKLKTLNNFSALRGNTNKNICYTCKNKTTPYIKIHHKKRIKRRTKKPPCLVSVKLRELIKLQIKSLGCQICGYSKCIAALEFHHIDRSTKIPKAINSDRFLDEIRKCILVCANCHREIENFIIRLDRTDIEHCQQVINLTIENLPTPRTN